MTLTCILRKDPSLGETRQTWSWDSTRMLVNYGIILGLCFSSLFLISRHARERQLTIDTYVIWDGPLLGHFPLPFFWIAPIIFDCNFYEEFVLLSVPSWVSTPKESTLHSRTLKQGMTWNDLPTTVHCHCTWPWCSCLLQPRTLSSTWNSFKNHFFLFLQEIGAQMSSKKNACNPSP